jgi:hypothetical protein
MNSNFYRRCWLTHSRLRCFSSTAFVNGDGRSQASGDPRRSWRLPTPSLGAILKFGAASALIGGTGTACYDYYTVLQALRNERRNVISAEQAKNDNNNANNNDASKTVASNTNNTNTNNTLSTAPADGGWASVSVSTALAAWLVPYLMYKLEHSNTFTVDGGDYRRVPLAWWARVIGAMARTSDVLALELVRGGCVDALAVLLSKQAVDADEASRVAYCALVANILARLVERSQARVELVARGGCELARDVALQLQLVEERQQQQQQLLQQQQHQSQQQLREARATIDAAQRRVGQCVALLLAHATSAAECERVIARLGVDALTHALPLSSSSPFAVETRAPLLDALARAANASAEQNCAAHDATRRLALVALRCAESQRESTMLRRVAATLADLATNEQNAVALCDDASAPLLPILARLVVADVDAPLARDAALQRECARALANVARRNRRLQAQVADAFAPTLIRWAFGAVDERDDTLALAALVALGNVAPQHGETLVAQLDTRRTHAAMLALNANVDDDDADRRRVLIVQQYARLVAQLTRQPDAARALGAVDDWRATAQACEARCSSFVVY